MIQRYKVITVPLAPERLHASSAGWLCQERFARERLRALASGQQTRLIMDLEKAQRARLQIRLRHFVQACAHHSEEKRSLIQLADLPDELGAK